MKPRANEQLNPGHGHSSTFPSRRVDTAYFGLDMLHKAACGCNAVDTEDVSATKGEAVKRTVQQKVSKTTSCTTTTTATKERTERDCIKEHPQEFDLASMLFAPPQMTSSPPRRVRKHGGTRLARASQSCPHIGASLPRVEETRPNPNKAGKRVSFKDDLVEMRKVHDVPTSENATAAAPITDERDSAAQHQDPTMTPEQEHHTGAESYQKNSADIGHANDMRGATSDIIPITTFGMATGGNKDPRKPRQPVTADASETTWESSVGTQRPIGSFKELPDESNVHRQKFDTCISDDTDDVDLIIDETSNREAHKDIKASDNTSESNTSVVDGVKELEQSNTQTTDTQADGQETLEASGRRKSIAMPGRQPFSESRRRSPASTCKTDKGESKSKGLEMLNPIIETEAYDEIPPGDRPSTTADQLTTSRFDISQHTSKERYPSFFGSTPQSAQPRGAPNGASGERLLKPSSIIINLALTSTPGTNSTATKPTRTPVYSSHPATKAGNILTTGFTTNRLLAPSYFQITKTTRIKGPSSGFASNTNPSGLESKHQVPLLPNNTRAFLPQQATRPTGRATFVAALQQIRHQNSWKIPHPLPTTIVRNVQHVTLPLRPGTLGTVAYPGWQTNSKVIHILPKTTAVPIRPQPAPVHYIVYQNPVVAIPPPPPPPPPPATNQVGQPTQNAQVISQHAAFTPTYYYQVVAHQKPLSQQRPSSSPQSFKDLSPPPPPPPPPKTTSKTEQKIQLNRPQEIPGVASPRKQQTTPTKSQTRSTSSSIPNGTLFVQTPKGLIKLSKQIRLQTKTPSGHHVDARRNEDVATSAVYKTNTKNPSCSPQTVKYLLALKKREKSSGDKTLSFPNRETAKIHPPFYLTNKNESGQLGSADREKATERKHLSSKTAISRVQKEGRDSSLKYPDPSSVNKSQTTYETVTHRGNVQKEVHTEANAKASSSRNESSNTTFRSKLDYSESLQFEPGAKSMHDFEGIGESSADHSSVKNYSNDIRNVDSIFYESGKLDEKETSDKLASLDSSPDERNSDETISYPKSSPSTCDEDGDKDESWLPPAHVKRSSKYIRRFRNPITGGLSKINIRTSESPRLRRKYKKWRKTRKTKNKSGLCKNESREENVEVSKREDITNTLFSLSPQENAKSDFIAKYGGMSDDGINNLKEKRADGCVPTSHRDIVEDSPPLSSPACSSASSLGDEASGMKNDHPPKHDVSLNEQGLDLQSNRPCHPTEISGIISGSPSKRHYVRGNKSQSCDSDTISPRNSKTVKFDVSDIPVNNTDAKRNQIQIRQARINARKGPNPAPLWQKVMKLLGIRRKPDKVSAPGATPWHKRRSSSVVLAESLAESAKRLENKAAENEDGNSGETSAADKNSPGIIKEKESCKTTKENKKGKKTRKRRRKRRRLAKTKVSPESPDDQASSSLTSIDFDARRPTRSRTRRTHDSDSISSNALDNSSPSSARRGRRTLASMSAQTWEDCYRSTYLKWKEASPSPDNLATDELKVITNELATPRAVPCKDRKKFQKLLMSKWENIVQTAQTGSVEQKYGTSCQDKGTKSEAIDLNLVDTPPVVVELDVSTTMQDSSLCSDPQDNSEEDSLRCEETAEKIITPDVVKKLSDPTAATELTPDEDGTIATNDSDGYGSPPVLSPIRDISTDAPFDQLRNTDAQNSQGFIIPERLTEDALKILAVTGNIDPDLTGVQAYALFMPDMVLGDQYMSSLPPHNLDIADYREVPPVISCHRLEYLSSLDDINQHEQILGPLLPSETTQNGLLPDDSSTENVEVQDTVGQFVPQDYRNRTTDGLFGKGSASPNETGQEVEGLGVGQTINSSTESLEEGEIVSD